MPVLPKRYLLTNYARKGKIVSDIAYFTPLQRSTYVHQSHFI